MQRCRGMWQRGRGEATHNKTSEAWCEGRAKRVRQRFWGEDNDARLKENEEVIFIK